jgi:hypothetical protein
MNLKKGLPTGITMNTNASAEKWFDDYAEDADDIQVEEYDITAAPNDFNIRTIYDFLESGAVRIPGFQRNTPLEARGRPGAGLRLAAARDPICAPI